MIENQPLHGRVHKVAERAQGVGNAYILGRESVTLLWSVPSRLELDLRLITTGLAQPDLVLAAGALAPGGGSYAFWLEVRVRVRVRVTVRVSLTRTRTRALTLTLTLTRCASRRTMAPTCS